MADQVQEYSRLENGQSVTSTNVIGHFFRDSQGRTRTESAQLSSPDWSIEIRDPLAGLAYTVNAQEKIWYRTRIPMQAMAPAPNPRATVDSLDAQTIDGILVSGTRTRYPSPSGGLTVDTWDSDELNVTVACKSSNGYSWKLINLSRDEPDPTLFSPQAGYTVVDR